MTRKHPIIILEGPDGAGKTTLAKAIGGHYIHSTYNNFLAGNMVGYMTGTMYAARQLAETSHVVLDRWRLSEIVYGNVFRDGPEQPDLDDALFDLAKECGAYHVLCQPLKANRHAYLYAFDMLSNGREEMYQTMVGVYDEYEKQSAKVADKIDQLFVYDRFEASPEDGVNALHLSLEYRGIKL